MPAWMHGGREGTSLSLGSRLKRPIDSEFRVVVVAFKQIFCSKNKNKHKKQKKKRKKKQTNRQKQKTKNLASIF